MKHQKNQLSVRTIIKMALIFSDTDYMKCDIGSTVASMCALSMYTLYTSRSLKFAERNRLKRCYGRLPTRFEIAISVFEHLSKLNATCSLVKTNNIIPLLPCRSNSKWHP